MTLFGRLACTLELLAHDLDTFDFGL